MVRPNDWLWVLNASVIREGAPAAQRLMYSDRIGGLASFTLNY